MSLASVSSILTTYIIAGYIGFKYSHKFKKSLSVKGWILLITLTILAAYVGVGTRIISIINFSINLNWFLQGLGLGTILRNLIKLFSYSNS
jgi:hypothetical protein